MNARNAEPLRAVPTVEHRRTEPARALAEDVLYAVSFEPTAAADADARMARVGLTPLRGGGRAEVWHVAGPVHTGVAGLVSHAADAELLAGRIELDERELGGIAGAAQAAYAALRAFQEQSTHRHVLRIWNYFDGINQGEGDEERYKLFCVGRAAALGPLAALGAYPAATAVGRHDGKPTLQVHWLAARTPGLALENPRQVSAYRYPRRYGPVAPGFSRAMLVGGRLLMISGTASIVGHDSHHPHDVLAQLDETLVNVGSVLRRAAAQAPQLPPHLGSGSVLRVYLREPAHVQAVEERLRAALPSGARYVILAADICRRELLVEIECVHGPERTG